MNPSREEMRPLCRLCGLEDGACICAHIPAPDPVRTALATALARRLCQLFDSGGESQRSVRARHASAIFQLLSSGATNSHEWQKCDADPVGYLEDCERAALRSAPQPVGNPLPPREMLELAEIANYGAKKLGEVDLRYVTPIVAAALNTAIERFWLIARTAKAIVPAEGGAREGWQPIETAPRDGARFLAYWGDLVPGAASAIDTTCWVNGNWCDPDDTEAHYGPFTCWQPLPAPPVTRPQSQTPEK